MSIKVDSRPLPSLPRPEASGTEVAHNTLAGQEAGPSLVNPQQAEALRRSTELGESQAPKARVTDTFSSEARRSAAPDAARSSDAARTTAKASDKDYVVISSTDDDPVHSGFIKEHLPKSAFFLDESGRPIGLEGPKVGLFRDDIIVLLNNETGQYEPYSNNPWQDAKPNRNGNFYYPKEPDQAVLDRKVDADGKVELDENGLQQWAPINGFAGQTTVFEAVNLANGAAEGWSGREIRWGYDGQLPIQTHAFAGFNAFFSPASRALFFGVIPYRLPGETDIKIFEMASQWEVAVHEAGHALHNDLKPNRGLVDEGYRQWGESFGDQLAMWTSLKDEGRAKNLIKETRGDLNRENSVTAIGEVFASLVGEGTGIREAFHNKKVSTTNPEFHDRSEVLTGAAYKVFVQIYNEHVLEGLEPVDAVMKAADIMGTLLVRATDYTPENTMTLKDVADAYLKVDKEYFGGKYGQVFAKEFEFREIYDANSYAEWEAAEAAIPELQLGVSRTDQSIERFMKENLDALGIPAEFGLDLQDHQVNAQGEHIVRVELTRGRDAGAPAVANHGVAVFSKEGKLLNFETPMPRGLAVGEALDLLDQAKAAGLGEKGTVGFVLDEEGAWTVAVVVPKPVESETGVSIGATYDVYSLAHPEGRNLDLEGHSHDELVERYGSLLPNGAEILLPESVGGTEHGHAH